MKDETKKYINGLGKYNAYNSADSLECDTKNGGAWYLNTYTSVYFESEAGITTDKNAGKVWIYSDLKDSLNKNFCQKSFEIADAIKQLEQLAKTRHHRAGSSLADNIIYIYIDKDRNMLLSDILQEKNGMPLYITAIRINNFYLSLKILKSCGYQYATLRYQDPNKLGLIAKNRPLLLKPLASDEIIILNASYLTTELKELLKVKAKQAYQGAGVWY